MSSERVCRGTTWTDDFVSAVISGVSLVFCICIGLMARNQFQRSDPQQIHLASKTAFFGAVGFSITQSMAGIGQNVLCTATGSQVKLFLILLSHFGYWATIQCVLATLILRLHETFRESLFPLSSLERKIMIGGFVTVQCLWITNNAFTVKAASEHIRDSTEPFVTPLWNWALYAVILVLFLTLSFATVLAFCRRLLSTAKELAKWITDVATNTNTGAKRSSFYVPSPPPRMIRLHSPKQNRLAKQNPTQTILGLSIRSDILSSPGQRPEAEPVDEVMTPNESACAKEAGTSIDVRTETKWSVQPKHAEQVLVEHTAEYTECTLSLGECDGVSHRGPSPATDDKSPTGPSRCNISSTATRLSLRDTTSAVTSDPSWFSTAL